MRPPTNSIGSLVMQDAEDALKAGEPERIKRALGNALILLELQAKNYEALCQEGNALIADLHALCTQFGCKGEAMTRKPLCAGKLVDALVWQLTHGKAIDSAPPEVGTGGVKKRRPPKPWKRLPRDVWAVVNWTKNHEDIARQLGVTPTAVSKQHIKFIEQQCMRSAIVGNMMRDLGPEFHPFSQMGKPVPASAKEAGYNECIAMNMTPSDASACVNVVSKYLALDLPCRAQKEGLRFLDLTGVYRLMAGLLCAAGRSAKEASSAQQTEGDNGSN